jgi:TonB family protein
MAQLEAQRQKVTREDAGIARAETARPNAESQESPRQEPDRLATPPAVASVPQAGAAAPQANTAAAQASAGAPQASAGAPQASAGAPQAGTSGPPGDANRQDAGRPPAATQGSPRSEAELEEEKREARLRAIGRQLDEEADRRDGAPASARAQSTLPLSLSTARRVRLWGRTHANPDLIRYSEAWEQKIQMNTPIDTVRRVASQLRTSPLVTVAVRSDGSVESVTFVLSSGVPEVDEAIRRVVRSLEHYPAFPPEVARDYDVIEIRRTWHFDVSVRLY